MLLRRGNSSWTEPHEIERKGAHRCQVVHQSRRILEFFARTGSATCDEKAGHRRGSISASPSFPKLLDMTRSPVMHRERSVTSLVRNLLRSRHSLHHHSTSARESDLVVV